MKTANPNLNTVPYWEKEAYRVKKHKYKDHENFHYRGEIKIVGKETYMQECKECHKILPSIAFTSASLRSDGAYYLQKACRQCRTRLELEKREARKNAPPKPDHCDCCHQRKFLTMDHTHGTTKVRGWLCTSCNSGLGSLEDTLEGVLQGAIYLENDESKIIETLHKVFNEMFARRQ
jgi:hypothetical protein